MENNIQHPTETESLLRVENYHIIVHERQRSWRPSWPEYDSDDGIAFVLFLAIFGCLFCFPPIGIVALFFACKADRAFEAGDMERGRSAKRTAIRLNIATFCLGVAAGIITIIVVLVVFVANAEPSHHPY